MSSNQYYFKTIITRGCTGFISLPQTYNAIYSTKFPSLNSNYKICLGYDFKIKNRSFTILPNLAQRVKSDSYFNTSIFMTGFETGNSYIKGDVGFYDNDISYTTITNNFTGNFYDIIKPELTKRVNFFSENSGTLIYTPNIAEIFTQIKELERLGNLYAVSEHRKNNELNSDDLKITYHIYYLEIIPTYTEFNYIHTKDNY